MDSIEGDWGDFEFRRTAPDMAAELEELVRNHYYPDEPLSIRLGYSEEYDKDLQSCWKPYLGNGLGFVVLDKSSGKIVAFRNTIEAKKDDPPMEFNSEITRKIIKVVNLADERSDVCNKYNVDKCALPFLTVVHRDFRGKGIVTEIYKRTIQLCTVLGYKVIKVCFSSPYSRKGAANAGFQQVACIDYYDLKDEKGNRLIENSQPGEILTQSVYLIK